jgi:fibrillarin-like pre-rRNA processing protein
MDVSFAGLPNTYFFLAGNREIIITRSEYPSHYGERKFNGYREWRKERSKFAVLIDKRVPIPIKEENVLLYLGAASGTTVSHLADVLSSGMIYAVEYAPKPFIKLLKLAKERNNIIPLLRDASRPETYSGIVEKVDWIYQDIAQKNQIEIFQKNVEFFLKEDGFGIIMVKARSIDSTRDVGEIYNAVTRKLEKEYTILNVVELSPYHKDHIAILIKL